MDDAQKISPAEEPKVSQGPRETDYERGDYEFAASKSEEAVRQQFWREYEGEKADYDRAIHTNPDAQAWAKFFVETLRELSRKRAIEKLDRLFPDEPGDGNPSIYEVMQETQELALDEAWMISWFANAMMAMHDHLEGQRQRREKLIEECPIDVPVPAELISAVYESVGTASMCWQPRPAGVFDSTEAAKVARELCQKIATFRRTSSPRRWWQFWKTA